MIGTARCTQLTRGLRPSWSLSRNTRSVEWPAHGANCCISLRKTFVELDAWHSHLCCLFVPFLCGYEIHIWLKSRKVNQYCNKLMIFYWILTLEYIASKFFFWKQSNFCKCCNISKGFPLLRNEWNIFPSHRNLSTSTFSNIESSRFAVGFQGICLSCSAFKTLRWFGHIYIPTIHPHKQCISTNMTQSNQSVNYFTKKIFHIFYVSSVLKIANKSLRVKWWTANARFVQRMQIVVSSTNCDHKACLAKAENQNWCKFRIDKLHVTWWWVKRNEKNCIRFPFRAQLRTAGHRDWAASYISSCIF